jgi:outer membrane protein TolC
MQVNRRIVHTLLFAVSLACGLISEGWGQTPQRPALTLQEAIELGLAHHPLVQGAQADALRAKASLAEAKAAVLPSVSASEDVTLSDDPVFAFGTKLRQARFTASDFALTNLNHPSPIGNFASSASASWVAFDSFATQRRVQSARDSAQAADLSRGFTDQEVANNVVALYYRALLAESQVGTAQANLVRAQEIANDIRDRVHSGLALEADGMRADLAVQNAKDDVASTQSNVSVARNELSEAIGKPLQGVVLVAPATPAVSATQPLQTDVQLSARLDLQALDKQKASAQQSLASIRAAVGPQLSTYAHVESDNPHFASGGSGNWTIGAKLEISVFDGGLRRAREQEAAAQLAKVTAEKEQTLREAHNTVRNLQAQIEDLQRRYATADQAIKANVEALQTSRDRYAAGLVPVSEVLNGESDLSSAEFARLRTFYQLSIANSDLQFATGTFSISKAGQP